MDVFRVRYIRQIFDMENEERLRKDSLETVGFADDIRLKV